MSPSVQQYSDYHRFLSPDATRWSPLHQHRLPFLRQIRTGRRRAHTIGHQPPTLLQANQNHTELCCAITPRPIFHTPAVITHAPLCNLKQQAHLHHIRRTHYSANPLPLSFPVTNCVTIAAVAQASHASWQSFPPPLTPRSQCMFPAQPSPVHITSMEDRCSTDEVIGTNGE